MITTICEIKRINLWKYFSNLWGEFFPADSGGKCLRDLFFQLYFNRINREQAKKDSQTSLQMWVDRKKIHSNKRHQFNLSKYVEPISSSSYEFIITLLYTPKQAFVKKCIHWYSRFRVKLILKNKDHYFLLINKSTNSEKKF